MQKLDPEIICHECGVSHAGIPVEEEAEAPVHCAECGAFLCLWKEIEANYMQPVLIKKA